MRSKRLSVAGAAAEESVATCSATDSVVYSFEGIATGCALFAVKAHHVAPFLRGRQLMKVPQSMLTLLRQRCQRAKSGDAEARFQLFEYGIAHAPVVVAQQNNFKERRNINRRRT